MLPENCTNNFRWLPYYRWVGTESSLDLKGDIGIYCGIVGKARLSYEVNVIVRDAANTLCVAMILKSSMFTVNVDITLSLYWEDTCEISSLLALISRRFTPLLCQRELHAIFTQYPTKTPECFVMNMNPFYRLDCDFFFLPLSYTSSLHSSPSKIHSPALEPLQSWQLLI